MQKNRLFGPRRSIGWAIVLSMTEASLRILAVLKGIPPGRVITYGQVAALAACPGAARQVVRLLHSSAGKLGLPWFRVLGAGGFIKLVPGAGQEVQIALLEEEGVVVEQGRVALDVYGWNGSSP